MKCFHFPYWLKKQCIYFLLPFQVSKNIVLQWGEMPTSVAYIGTGQIMGWGNKAIEIRSVETGHLDGVFMHKKAQRLKFLCERNDKVYLIFRFLKGLFLYICLYLNRCFSRQPKVVHLVKYILWRSINLEWPIGNLSLAKLYRYYLDD